MFGRLSPAECTIAYRVVEIIYFSDCRFWINHSRDLKKTALQASSQIFNNIWRYLWAKMNRSTSTLNLPVTPFFLILCQIYLHHSVIITGAFEGDKIRLILQPDCCGHFSKGAAVQICK